MSAGGKKEEDFRVCIQQLDGVNVGPGSDTT